MTVSTTQTCRSGACQRHGLKIRQGKYAANAAWTACAVIAFSIARATAVAADLAKARWASLRTKIINIPGRIASTARRLDLHLPCDWPWASAWQALHQVANAPPASRART